MSLTIDLNSDLGESYGAWSMGDDAGVLRSVSSANVAAGYHAGDPITMRRTIKLCAESGTAVGAHISYPDVMGFGRRNMVCTPDEIYCYSLYQIGAVQAFCRAAGMELQHVKPHGALYNMAAKDRSLADAIAHAVKSTSSTLILMGLAGTKFDEAAEAAGVPYAAEAFADRAYMPDGSLMPRSMPGSIIHDADAAASRVVQMVTKGTVTASDGSEIKFRPDTVCLHGDTAEAVSMAAAVKDALEAAGVKVVPLRDR